MLYLFFIGNYQRTSKEDESIFVTATQYLFQLSLLISMFVFTLIAVERYLSISKPFWHRTNVSKGRILKCLFVTFLVSLLFAAIQVFSSLTYKYEEMVSAVCGLLWIIAVFSIFLISFIKAYKFLQQKRARQANATRSQQNANQTGTRNDHHIDKKIFRLTLIFSAMYGVYLMAIFPGVTVLLLELRDGQKTWISIMIMGFLFTATSVVNPILTLSLKEDFKVFQADRSEIHALDNQCQI